MTSSSVTGFGPADGRLPAGRGSDTLSDYEAGRERARSRFGPAAALAAAEARRHPDAEPVADEPVSEAQAQAREALHRRHPELRPLPQLETFEDGQRRARERYRRGGDAA